MKTLAPVLLLYFISILLACHSTNPTKIKINSKEPADSVDYRHIKYDFYLGKTGQLCERKLVMARPRDSSCNCNFVIVYDSLMSTDTGYALLRNVIDIDSFTWIDSTDFSKDKNKAYYFYGNSGGGSRVIIDAADATTFKRLCEYRWDIDKEHVFYQQNMLKGLNLQKLQVLYSTGTPQFVEYVKDDKNVFFGNTIIDGADAKTFTLVANQKWQAIDKNYKYEGGRRQ